MTSNGSHDHTGHATRATTEKILRLLKADSAHAAELHEEIPDWVDIERRPAGWVATPAYRPRPTAPPPKPKEITMPKAPTIPSPQTIAERRRVQAALESAGIKAATCARLIGVNSGNLVRWLAKGKGMSGEKLEPVFAWCDQVEKGGWVAPIDGRKLPRRADRECSCTYLDAQPCGAPGCLWPGLIEFNPEPYPETTTPAKPWGFRTQEEIDREASERAQEQVAKWESRLAEPEPDPSAHVLETWAAQKLTYAMETLGLPMPEGYRFRVTVERA